MKNLVIGIVAVKQPHIDRATALINQLIDITSADFLVLTDEVGKFSYSSRIIPVKYENKIFSYHDKKIIFEECAKIASHTLLLDADHGVRENNTLKILDEMNIDEQGIYPQMLWKPPALCSFESFVEGKNDRVPYGKEFKEFCESSGLKMDNVFLVQESFLLVKNGDKIPKFLEIWSVLAKFCEQKDTERRQGILGYGEGYSIGVAARNADLPVVEHYHWMHKIAKDFKHFAWER